MRGVSGRAADSFKQLLNTETGNGHAIPWLYIKFRSGEQDTVILHILLCCSLAAAV